MAQPARVLPSNAPPLRDSNEHSSRALQEQSGNRQQVYQHHPSTVYDQKLSSSVLTENAYAVRAPPASGLYYTHTQPYYRTPWPRVYGDHDFEARNRVEREWPKLYDRFLQCPKYKDYRSRQHKDDKTAQDQKWPEPLERAFFKALLRWPPMGRRKQMHKDKQRGRNELIADYIHELTGVARTRKQVSSHIQVLKPLVDQDQVIMKWLSEKDHGPEMSRHLGGYHSGYATGRQRSTYPASAQHMSAADQGMLAQMPSGSEIRKAKQHPDVFEPVQFKLFVQPSEDPNNKQNEAVEPLHVYSKSAPQPNKAEYRISDWPTFQQDFPVLAQLHAARPIDCNVLAVEASLAMPTRSWRDNKGIELAVILNCCSRRLLNVSKVQCVNRFYRSGKSLPHSEYNGSGEAPLSVSESGSKAETRLKFGSGFWAITLSPTSHLAKSVMAMSQAEAQDRARMRQSVDADIRSITATQEIFVMTDTGLEAVLVMHWSFRLSSNEVGSTTWRRVHLPATMTSQSRVKNEGLAVDTPFDFNAPIEVSTSVPSQNYPALQSPFEYDSGSASAPSPATWPTTISTSGSSNIQQQQQQQQQQHHHHHHQQHHQNQHQQGMGECGSAENSFDLASAGGNMNMVFDTNMNLDGFDSTTFDFGLGADAQFAHDPATAMEVNPYGQSWCGPYGDGFENEQQWHDFGAAQVAADYSVYAVHAAAAAAAASTTEGQQQTSDYTGYDTYQKHCGEQAYAGAVERAKDDATAAATAPSWLPPRE